MAEQKFNEFDSILANYSQEQLMDMLAEEEGYVTTPVDIEQFIEDPYYIGNTWGGVHEHGDFAGLPKVFPFWRKHLYDIYPDPFTSDYTEIMISGAIGCLHGDTKIKLLNGTSKTIKNLYDENAKDFWVYSYDVEYREWAPGKVTNVWSTGRKKVLKLTLTIDGSDKLQDIICTSDHRFLLTSGYYKEAKDLTPQDSIQSIYLRMGDIKQSKKGGRYCDYLCFYDSNSMSKDGWIPVHKQVGKHLPKPGRYIHHRDKNKLNNSPDNLDAFDSNSEHIRHHWNEHWADDSNRKERGKWRGSLNESGVTVYQKAVKMVYIFIHEYDYKLQDDFDSCRDRAIKDGYVSYKTPKKVILDTHNFDLSEIYEVARLKRYFKYKTSEIIEENKRLNKRSLDATANFNRTSHPRLRKDVTWEVVLSTAKKIGSYSAVKIANELKCSRTKVSTLIYSNFRTTYEFALYLGFEPHYKSKYEYEKRYRDVKNHRVVRSEILDTEVETYDMSVEKYANYGIEDCEGNLVITHNTGKTTLAVIGLAYDLHRLLLLKSPQSKFGHPDTTIIATALFTATKSVGGMVLYQQMLDLIQASPFFRKFYHPKPNRPEVWFTSKNIGVVSGSRFTDALGMAIIQGIIDEANFQNVRVNQVQDSYNNIQRRIESRFTGLGNKLPCRLWTLSSKNDSASFLEELINKNRDKSHVKIIEASRWEVMEFRGLYSGKKFRVFMGDEHKDPFIVAKGQAIPNSVDPSRIIDVPEEFYHNFEEDILGSLRDIAGCSTTSKMNLFRSEEQFSSALYATPKSVTQDIIRLDMKEDGNQIKDYLAQGFWDVVMKSKATPHFLHLDLSLTTDRTGIAMCHAHGNREVPRVDPMTGRRYYVQELMVLHDFAFAIEAMPGEEIPYWKILDFIVFLRAVGINLGGINPENQSRSSLNSYDKRLGTGLITADSFQSADMGQRLQKQGFEFQSMSVDRTKAPFHAYKRAVLDGRVLTPRSEQLVKELLHVADVGQKFDHPKKFKDGTTGSKDILDSVVGSFYMCQENANSSQLYADRLVSSMQTQLDKGELLWNKKFGSFV